jgi:hypothetical protein
MVSKLKEFSTTAASNNSAAPNGFPEGMAPSSVNNAAREMMARLAEFYQDAQWINLHTPTYVGATQFSVVGDQTAHYVIGRRVRAVGTTPFTIYGTITLSAFSSVTTVTVNWDGAGALDNTLASIEVGILTPKANAEVAATLAYNDQSGTTYLITSGDNGQIVTLNNASPITVTLPQDSTESQQNGFHCVIRQLGAGQVTVVTQGSDTLRAPTGTKTRVQYSSIFIDLPSAGSPQTWYLTGDATS